MAKPAHRTSVEPGGAGPTLRRPPRHDVDPPRFDANRVAIGVAVIHALVCQNAYCERHYGQLSSSSFVEGRLRRVLTGSRSSLTMPCPPKEGIVSTTDRLDLLLDRHRDRIESLVGEAGLPLHLFFVEQMAETARAYDDVLRSVYPNGCVAFAVKSNPCRGALRAAARLRLGADVASEYELRAALEEGIDPAKIVCNGNAKSVAYHDAALSAGTLIALDNDAEIEQLEERSRKAGRRADVLLRFRGMPLAGLTSDDQTTAADWTKFGFHIDDAERLFARLATSDRLRFRGPSAHIGTQIADPGGYELLLDRFLRLADAAVRRGLSIDRIDIGGGFPVAFLTPDQWAHFTERLLARRHGGPEVSDAVTWNDLPMGYAHIRDDETAPARWIGKSYWSAYPAARMLDRILTARTADGSTVVDRLIALGRPRLIIEPGRSLMATAGVTLARAAGVKTVLGHAVVSLDLGINNHGTNLISPDIFPAAVLPRRPGDRPVEAFLAGRLCFSGDMISKAKIELNRLPHPGERCVIYHTGAYSADHFASNSCGFPRPAKVAVLADGTAELWRAAERFEDVFGPTGSRLAIDDAPDARDRAGTRRN